MTNRTPVECELKTPRWGRKTSKTVPPAWEERLKEMDAKRKNKRNERKLKGKVSHRSEKERTNRARDKGIYDVLSKINM